MDLTQLPGIIRRGRRNRDMSQRQLAAAVETSPATLGAIESGLMLPGLTLFERVLDALDLELVVIDRDGKEVTPYNGDGKRDRARRQYPAHLDTRPVGSCGEGWWGRWTVMPWIRQKPEHTFDLDRRARDHLRREEAQAEAAELAAIARWRQERGG